MSYYNNWLIRMSLDLKPGLAGEIKSFYISKSNRELYNKHIWYQVNLTSFYSHENIYVE